MAQRNGVIFWAWMVSIGMHLAALTGFGFVRFSQAEVEQRPVPTAKINQVKKIIQTANVIPKPKVKKAHQRVIAEKKVSLLSADEIFGDVKPISKDWPTLAESSVSASEFAFQRRVASKEGVEFFGSFAEERKIYYVVDCSGSMQGVFGHVREQLKESIEKLEPDQYFYIIFFGGNDLFEFGDGELKRATEDVKAAAYEFINSVEPAGQTNALAAFYRIMEISGNITEGSAVVYFLTDGFELNIEDELGFSQALTELLAGFAPGTRINTIGFWPQSSDREMLRTIAEQSGGEVVIVDNY